MLASTVQFSTYDQSPPATTPPNPTHPQVVQRYEIQMAPTEATDPAETGRPFPQDPTACLQPAPTPPTPFHTPPSEERRRRTRSSDELPAELVSVPPSSTTQATSAHP